MALTVRTNGTGASNLITAQWFNDYHDLLTGVMADQPVTINNTASLKGITFTTPTAPTLATHTGTGPGIGSYTYAVTYGMGNGLTKPGTTAAITTTTGNQQVTLSAIPTGPTGTNYRILYRSKVGTSSPLYQLATLGDNTTTTYLDSLADTSLTVLAPSHGSFGGSLLTLDQSGNVKAQIFNDGAVSFDAGAISSDGAGNLTVASITTGGGNLSISSLTVSGLINGIYFDTNSGGSSARIGSSAANAGSVMDCSNTNLYMKAPNGGFVFQSPTGTNRWSRTAEAKMSGTGNGSFTCPYPGSYDIAIPNPCTAGSSSQTIGLTFACPTAVTTGAGLAWQALVVKF